MSDFDPNDDAIAEIERLRAQVKSLHYLEANMPLDKLWVPTVEMMLRDQREENDALRAAVEAYEADAVAYRKEIERLRERVHDLANEVTRLEATVTAQYHGLRQRERG